MRGLGATRVRAGHLEAAFAAPQEAPQEPRGGQDERVHTLPEERAELERLREMQRRAEELGVEL